MASLKMLRKQMTFLLSLAMSDSFTTKMSGSKLRTAN